MQFTQGQWLLLFFTYGFLGWIWESGYVSFLDKEWVNRGFLQGPVLPIYGFGAIIILGLTLPFQDSLPLIFLIGMAGASLLEYVTGWAMESLFKMRYWDYSDKRFNINGYISLFTSVAWGVFSLLLVRILNPPIEQILHGIPDQTANLLSLVLVAIFAVDATKSVQSALDLKELMAKLSENNESFAALEERIDAAAANITQSSEEFREHLEQIESDFQTNIGLLQERIDQRQKSRKVFILGKLKERRDRKSRLLSLLNEKTDSAIAEINKWVQTRESEAEKTRFTAILEELHAFKADLKKVETGLAALRDREYQRAASLLRRNPTAASIRFQKAIDEIKSLNNPKNKQKGSKDKNQRDQD